MADNQQIRKQHILVVEGTDEQYFFDALLRNIDISSIQVVSIGGKTQFRSQLGAFKNLPGFSRVDAVGIVRDCDANRQGAFDSVCGALRANELSIPEAPLAFTGSTPRVGVLVMPPQATGTDRMLEDLCLAAVSDDPAMNCVEAYFDCLQAQEINLRETVVAKARLHTFLASRQDPDLRLGEAAQRGYWPWDSPAFDQVKAFLRQLADV